MKKLVLAMALIMALSSVAQAGELVLNEPVATCTHSGLTLEECNIKLEKSKNDINDVSLIIIGFYSVFTVMVISGIALYNSK